MSRRASAGEASDYTFGHNLLTTENIRKLAEQATHWAIVLKFDHAEKVPSHNLFPTSGFISLFEQGRLTRTTLLTGFRTTRAPKRPVPACFFRTLDFLLQYTAAGNIYRAIADKEEAKGSPPAAWCRPPVVASREDAETMTAAALASTPASMLERVPATDPIRLFYSSRSWACFHSYQLSASTIKITLGVSPAEMYDMYCAGQLSEYLPLVGFMEADPPVNTYAPPSVMTPLGALLFMHGYGRPYLPLSIVELRDVRSNGLMSLSVRPTARPLQLPQGVWPVGTDPGSQVTPGMDAGMYDTQPLMKGSRPGGAGGGTVSGNDSSRSSAAAAASRQSSRSEASTATAAGSGGFTSSGGRSGANEAATPRPSDLEPDPILDDSSRWILKPKPFNEFPPAAAADMTEVTASNGGFGAAGVVVDDAALSSGGAAAAAANLPSSCFLQYNTGVQPSYETPALRLFLGDRGQAGLKANWWYEDCRTQEIKGPFSPEAMLLSCITPCREIHDETLLCGTDADVKPPMVPPLAAFLPMGTLLGAVTDGTYAMVSRMEILSPLARNFLGNRIRQPKPEPPPPSFVSQPTAVVPPVVITVQAGTAPPPPQQPQPQPAATAMPAMQFSLTRPPMQFQVVAAPPQQQQQQQSVVTAEFPALAAATAQNVGRGLPLSHIMAARPRLGGMGPMAAGSIPFYSIPGSAVYMPQYGQPAPYGEHAFMAQPVFGNTLMHSATTMRQQQ